MEIQFALMSDPETDEIIRLQQLLTKRLAEVGIVRRHARDNLARELAHVAVLGRAFSERTLPLIFVDGSAAQTDASDAGGDHET